MNAAAPLSLRALPAAVASLAPFVAAGVLEPIDVHFAAALARLGPETDPTVLLGAALASRVPRHGHVCVELRRIADSVAIEGADTGELVALPWPDPDAWASALAASTIVAPGGASDDDPRPLVLASGRLYLDRMWRDERFVADDLKRRAALDADDWTVGADDLLAEFFPADAAWAGPDLQRHAAITMLRRALTIVAGGPGTGKTRALARVMALLRRRVGSPLAVALAAPTGKAAARMGEAVRNELWGAGAATELFPDVQPTTLHRLLGLGPRRRAATPIGADLVIVDEASMVSLPLMAQLLRALPDTTRLVLVGDPGQLASVEAGTVLADIVGDAGHADRAGSLGEAGRGGRAGPLGEAAHSGRAGPLGEAVVVLQRPFRFDQRSDIQPLAEAIRAGDAATVHRLLDAGHALRFVEHDDPLTAPDGAGIRRELVEGAAVTYQHATAGRASDALSSTRAVRLLCAHRRGHHGVERWNPQVERWLEADVAGFDSSERWYVGRPVLITRNDPVARLNNGDIGVVVAEADGERTVAVERADGLGHLRPVQLADIETMHAMTIHKSQGSEFERVVVLLPPADSRLATRELLYTAVTRAKQELIVVGTRAALDAALSRRVSRASGLADALWGPTDP
ncbi:MAG: exodeoxyribonuclease V subunit alpha [Acidimicrobiia bacterium]